MTSQQIDLQEELAQIAGPLQVQGNPLPEEPDDALLAEEVPLSRPRPRLRLPWRRRSRPLPELATASDTGAPQLAAVVRPPIPHGLPEELARRLPESALRLFAQGAQQMTLFKEKIQYIDETGQRRVEQVAEPPQVDLSGLSKWDVGREGFCYFYPEQGFELVGRKGEDPYPLQVVPLHNPPDPMQVMGSHLECWRDFRGPKTVIADSWQAALLSLSVVVELCQAPGGAVIFATGGLPTTGRDSWRWCRPQTFDAIRYAIYEAQAREAQVVVVGRGSRESTQVAWPRDAVMVLGPGSTTRPQRGIVLYVEGYAQPKVLDCVGLGEDGGRLPEGSVSVCA